MLIATDLSKHYRHAARPAPDPRGRVARRSSAASRSPSWDRPGAARARCSTCSARSSRRRPARSRSTARIRTRSSEREQAAFRGAHIGFVFQDHLLLPQLSALDNVLAPTLVAPAGADRAALGDRARALLDRRRPRRSARPSARRAVRRRAPARRDRARADPPAVARALRRADRQSRSRVRRRRRRPARVAPARAARRCWWSSRTARRWPRASSAGSS